MNSLLTEKEAAPRIHRRPSTLERYRRLRIGPPFYRVNGRVLYKAEDLDAWIESTKQIPGKSEGSR